MLPNVCRQAYRTLRCRHAALGCFAPMPLRADPPDMLLLNGKIVTLDDTSSVKEALAITGDRITATGSDDEMRKLAGAATTIIDLGGRTVIPGLIDSHIHLIRAGFRYADEVDWSGATSIIDALERLRSAAMRAKPGAWLIVAGGWTPRQFTECQVSAPLQALGEWTEMLRWNSAILCVILVCFAAMMLSPLKSGAGEAVSERDELDNGPSFFGEAKEVGSLRSVQGVKVKAQFGEQQTSTYTNDEGSFKIPSFGKETVVDNVIIACAKDGFRTLDISRSSSVKRCRRAGRD
jgi:hypothetical protein